MNPSRRLSSHRITQYMDLVIEVVKPSPISSHIKGDVLLLLERLRDEEALRRIKEEVRDSPAYNCGGMDHNETAAEGGYD